MVGVTCAACHTGEFTYQGKRFVIDGAPSKVDLRAFFEDLFGSATSLRNNIQSLLQFYWKVNAEPAPPPEAATGVPPQLQIPQEWTLDNLRAMVASIDGNSLLHSNDHFDAEVVAKLTQQLEEDRRTFDAAPNAFARRIQIAPVASGTEAIPPGVKPGLSLEDLEKISAAQLKNSGLASSKSLEDLQKFGQASADSVLNQIASTPEERSARLGISFNDIRTQFQLLLARVEFLKTLTNLPVGGTPSGLGRLDAFGNARDLLWPNSPVPLTAPVSYPALWNFPDEEYLHWDANTTSVIERNIGQALALGAVLDDKTSKSTVNPRHLHQLEMLATKLEAPKWPEAVFGPINREESAKGEVLFRANCARCHAPENGEQVLMSPEEVGTDRMRAVNFAQPVGNVGFDVAVQAKLERIRVQAYKDNGVTPAEAIAFDGKQPLPGQPRWRVTRKYVSGTLHGIWATSPYLHNGSVLNLHELLLPSAERRKTFMPGARSSIRKMWDS